MAALNDDQREHFERIATPLAVASSLGKDILGYDLQIKPHHLYLEERVLDAVLDTEQRFIAISVGPRQGKTSLLGQFLPTWYLGMFPNNQVIYASYGEDRSKETGRWVRDALKLKGNDLFGLTVSKESASAVHWKLQGHQGGMLSVGRDGPILGEPGHLIVADDLFKGPKEANSATVRKAAKDWFEGTLRARLEPGGTMIVFFQRWHVDDIIGDLQEAANEAGYSGDVWEFINIPSLAEAPVGLDDVELGAWRDVLGRRDGEALWPERFSRETLLRIKGNNEASFRAIHQGDPRPGSGGWFPREKWGWYDPADIDKLQFTGITRVWDLAATKDGGDWTVGTKGAVDAGENLYILDVQRFRRDADEVQKAVKTTAKSDRNHVKIMIEQEKAGSGKTVVTLYKRAMPGYTIEPAKPEGSKKDRATPYNTHQSIGKILLPRHADGTSPDWVEKWIAEHEAFLKQTTDDQVDTGSYVFRDLIAEGAGMEIWVPEVVMASTPAQLRDAFARVGF